MQSRKFEIEGTIYTISLEQGESPAMAVEYYCPNNWGSGTTLRVVFSRDEVEIEEISDNYRRSPLLTILNKALDAVAIECRRTGDMWSKEKEHYTYINEKTTYQNYEDFAATHKLTASVVTAALKALEGVKAQFGLSFGQSEVLRLQSGILSIVDGRTAA